MKVAILQGSPNKNGVTATMTQSFARGLEAGGASVVVLNAYDLKVERCCGTMACWKKTPGVCCIKDDMRLVLDQLNGTDVLVLASPVYTDGMTAALKAVLDRTIPLGQPFLSLRNGVCRHEVRKGIKPPKQIVLISNCGFHEIENFDSLVKHVQALAKNFGAEFSGALLRPHGPALAAMQKLPVEKARLKAQRVLDAVMKAGRDLAIGGEISQEVMAEVSVELLPQQAYILNANTAFHAEIAKGRLEKLKEYFVNPFGKPVSPVPV